MIFFDIFDYNIFLACALIFYVIFGYPCAFLCSERDSNLPVTYSYFRLRLFLTSLLLQIIFCFFLTCFVHVVNNSKSIQSIFASTGLMGYITARYQLVTTKRPDTRISSRCVGQSCEIFTCLTAIQIFCILERNKDKHLSYLHI